jgi:hypothetical protein
LEPGGRGHRREAGQARGPAQGEGREGPKGKAERKPRRKALTLFERIERKEEDPEGSTRFWCHGCQDSFVSETDKPEACASGHRADDAELASAPAPEAVAAEREAVEA